MQSGRSKSRSSRKDTGHLCAAFGACGVDDKKEVRVILYSLTAKKLSDIVACIVRLKRGEAETSEHLAMKCNKWEAEKESATWDSHSNGCR